MMDLSWEVPGKRTNPLEQNGNMYQVLFDKNMVQVYENRQLIIEEDLNEELAAHRDPSIALEDQLLGWARSVLDTFVQTCSVCKQEKMAFPIQLTALASYAGSFQNQHIEAICPACENKQVEEMEHTANNLKQAFLKGDLHIFGGSEKEIGQLLRSSQGLAFRQYLNNLDHSWTLGRLCFSPHRYYIVALKLNENEIESFLLLTKDSQGHIQGLPPEIGLEALGFQPGDQIEIQAFQL